jgi:hypothetical protein
MELIPEFVTQAPLYHILVEVLLFICVLWLLFRKSYSPNEKSKLSEKVKTTSKIPCICFVYFIKIYVSILKGKTRADK